MGKKFDFDQEIFHKALDILFDQFQKKEGIFRNGYKQFLPQWNLPSNLEESPKKSMPKKPYEASLWLWTRNFCERKSRSDVLAKNAINCWENEGAKWIFFPEEILKHNYEEIKGIFKKNLEYYFSHPNEKPIEVAYFDNAKKLKEEYGSDPRKLIQGHTVEKARENIMSFDKYGQGISNLYIGEMISRQIALPLDPENALVKIDVHRERFPLIIGAINPKTDLLHHEYGINLLEQEFFNYYKSKGLNYNEMIELDQALWIVGSQICAKKSLDHCRYNCSLEDMCKYFPQTSKRGTFTISKEGKRIDIRKGDRNQLRLF